jgi:hypothetical protein
LLNFFGLTRGFLHKGSQRCCCGLAIDCLYPFRIPNHNIPYTIANMSPYYFTIARWNEFQCCVDSCSGTLLGGVGVIHLFKMWMKLMTWKIFIHIHVHVDDDFMDGWNWSHGWKWTIFHDMKLLMKWQAIIKLPQNFVDIHNMDEIFMLLGSVISYLSSFIHGLDSQMFHPFRILHLKTQNAKPWELM